MLGVMGAGDPYTIFEPSFVARFLLDPGADAAATVANVDVFVDLPDGSVWALTIFTIDEVGRLLASWKEAGEAANGSYFWAVDQLIVPEPGVAAMTAAIGNWCAAETSSASASDAMTRTKTPRRPLRRDPFSRCVEPDMQRAGPGRAKCRGARRWSKWSRGC
jgi:hypothetical protein